jgi:hypothetical protein
VLTQGYVTFVSPADAGLLQKCKWHATRGKARVVYVARSSNKGHSHLTLHREILGEAAGEHTDHKDHDGTNNRRSNLRPASRSQNLSNGRYARGTSGFRGVIAGRTGRWSARVANQHVGTFATPEAAARAYDAAAIELFGEFATTNFPGKLTPFPNPRSIGGEPVGGTRFALQRAAYSIPEFCFRNQTSRPTYHRLRAEGRGPKEMRIGLNVIRITADAEREWQRRMEQDDHEFEARATERAVKAGGAAVKSAKHVSNRRQPR